MERSSSSRSRGNSASTIREHPPGSPWTFLAVVGVLSRRRHLGCSPSWCTVKSFDRPPEHFPKVFGCRCQGLEVSQKGSGNMTMPATSLIRSVGFSSIAAPVSEVSVGTANQSVPTSGRRRLYNQTCICRCSGSCRNTSGSSSYGRKKSGSYNMQSH